MALDVCGYVPGRSCRVCSRMRVAKRRRGHLSTKCGRACAVRGVTAALSVRRLLPIREIDSRGFDARSAFKNVFLARRACSVPQNIDKSLDRRYRAIESDESMMSSDSRWTIASGNSSRLIGESTDAMVERGRSMYRSRGHVRARTLTRAGDIARRRVVGKFYQYRSGHLVTRWQLLAKSKARVEHQRGPSPNRADRQIDKSRIARLERARGDRLRACEYASLSDRSSRSVRDAIGENGPMVREGVSPDGP